MMEKKIQPRLLRGLSRWLRVAAQETEPEFKSSNERRARCFLRLDDDQDNSENAGKKGGGNPTDVLTQ